MGAPRADYDRIGRDYAAMRRTEPAIAAAIREALGDARTVVNVGAGAGSYEPADREVVAVEPSPVMRAQRPARAAPVVDAEAEALPFPDGSFDAALAVFSDHHWRDRTQGLREMRRVARRRVVLFNVDPVVNLRFWLTAEYLPSFTDLVPEWFTQPGRWRAHLERTLGPVHLVTVPIPHDCRDGFYAAYWRRPEAYLDPEVRFHISVFHRLDADDVERGMERLSADLESGAWAARHADLLERETLDVGCRVVVAEAGLGG
jgi:SAM-dependent methyltransferase